MINALVVLNGTALRVVGLLSEQGDEFTSPENLAVVGEDDIRESTSSQSGVLRLEQSWP